MVECSTVFKPHTRMKQNDTKTERIPGVITPDRLPQADGRLSIEENPISPVSALPGVYDFETPPNSSSEMGQTSLADQEKDVTERAKYFKPGITQVVNLIDAGGVRAVIIAASRRDYSKEELAILEDKAQMSADNHLAMVNCGARLSARYCKSPEAADWAGLLGAITSWSFGLIGAIQEINKRPLPAGPNNERINNLEMVK